MKNYKIYFYEDISHYILFEILNDYRDLVIFNSNNKEEFINFVINFLKNK